MIVFERLKVWLLVVGLVSMLAALLVKIPESAQQYVFLAVILLVGVPHGSLDYFIEKQTQNSLQHPIELKKFLFRYITVMLLYGSLWWIQPMIALILFIFFTAYHFGEIDWPIRPHSWIDRICYTFYGFSLILFIITSHLQESVPILNKIVLDLVNEDKWYEWGGRVFSWSCLGLGIFFISLTIIYRYIGWSTNVFLLFLLQSVILISVIYFMPLYLSFSFYFGLWHSVISFNLIRKQLYLTNSWSGWRCLISKALPFILPAWLGIAGLVYFTADTEWLILSNVFIGIAILTLPHLHVFTKITLGEDSNK